MTGDNTKSKRTLIRKCILLLLLAAVGLFLYTQRYSLRSNLKVYVDPNHSEAVKKSIDLQGDHVIEQGFIAESDLIGKIGVCFYNDAADSVSGTISLEILDQQGTVISETSMAASGLNMSGITKFVPGGDSEGLNANHIVSTQGRSDRLEKTEVDEGEQYTLRITAEDISSDGRIGIVLDTHADSSETEVSNAVVDGTEQDGSFVRMFVMNHVFSPRTMRRIAAIFILTLCLILLPYEKLDERAAKRSGKAGAVFSKYFSIVAFLLTPLVSYYIIQTYIGYDISAFISQLANPAIGILNIVVIGLIWWAIFTVSNSLRITSALTCLLASVFGFVNYMLVLFRDSPLVATDIAQIGTAMQVAGSYKITADRQFLWAILITAAWIIIQFAPPACRGLSLRKRLIPLAILVVWAGAFHYLFFDSSYIKDHEIRVSSFKPKGSYFDNGCAVSFVVTVGYAIVEKPAGYNAADIDAMCAEYESDEAVQAEKVSESTPNIIVIMNESFSDMSVIGSFETNEDYLPFYHSLKDETVNGWMHSSVYGGSTANSEFECLTGFSMINLPLNSVPYRSIIKNETPSLTYQLKSMGYGGLIAFHPGMSNSYNRNNVYPLLGFDRHISAEDLEDPEKVRDYVSDEYDYEIVEEEYEAFRAQNGDTPFYMFNVTIQNHAGYTLSAGVVDEGIRILNLDVETEQAEQFLNLMKKSDEALEDLIEYYSGVDEETVILLFGDHQPRLDEDFYDYIRSLKGDISDLEWADLMHQVPFMIWANYDIGASDSDVHISANYFSSYLKQLIGMPMTGFDKYMTELRSELPVVNAICCIDSNGNMFDPAEQSDYSDRLKEYARIQYNGLIDNKNRSNGFFELK